MSDESLPVIATGVVGLGAKLAYDVLGPTCKYLGSEIKGGAEVGATNIKRVFERAHSFILQKREQGGAVPPRVIKDVLEQSYFCEDEVQACYLGGVLASSKTGEQRDDRAVAYLSIINSLSTYQLRAHFLLYSAVLRIEGNTFQRMKGHLVQGNVTVRISEEDFTRVMEIKSMLDDIPVHCFAGLNAKGLIQGGILYHPHPGLTIGAFRYFYPTQLGMQLFLWGIGCGHLTLHEFAPDLLQKVDLGLIIEPLDIRYDHCSW